MAVDWQAAVADYQRNQPGMTYVDELLQPDALQELYEYCLESTVWYDFSHNGYVGAYADDGFDSPLLFRIAEGLRAAMPELLHDHPVRFIWAYRYDQRLKGIGTHADMAAVNVNFWITPNSANLDPDFGGLVVYRAEAAPDWEFAKYNNDKKAIRHFLKQENAGSLRIPYRRNRAVIFNSNLFHATDSFHFREGFENRRINITMLFGDRIGRHFLIVLTITVKPGDGLSAQAKNHLLNNPTIGQWFVFINRRRIQIKVLAFKEGGYCLWVLRQQLDWFKRQLVGVKSKKRLDVDPAIQGNFLFLDTYWERPVFSVNTRCF